ncbi:MAG: TonB-dependent receptor [Planctomycetes bacterium]|nr:TonB-dependent receptor [Planctomycetota bacterium]
MRRYVHSGALLCATLAAPVCLRAQEPTTQGSEEFADLTNLSLEEMLDVEVSLVSRRAQRIGDAPASVYVITRRDIEQSGLTSIPELLRLVPGVHVKRIQSGRWAVGTRGQPGEFANNLLVLMDGRSVYTPLFSGVYWDMQDLVLDDIERIEVIRGPGGTIWGANAVNGVINVITKSARDSQGGQFRSVLGDSELESYLNYGFALGEDLHVRLQGHWFDRDGFAMPGEDANDWRNVQGGVRLDWTLDENDDLSVQVNAYRGDAEQQIDLALPTPPDFHRLVEDVIQFSGTNALARWHHRFDEHEDIDLQIYYDRTRRNEEAFEDSRDTWDLDFQHRFQPFEDHELVWGLGYRYIRDEFDGGFQVETDPKRRNYQVFSFFVQDEWRIVEDGLSLIVGTKVEHNDFSGFELQPSLRLVWNVNEENTVWAAISRAVETPSRATHDIRIRAPIIDVGGGFMASPEYQGSQEARATDLVAFELGWRGHVLDELSLDLALFYNDYEHVSTQEPGLPYLDPSGLPVLPLVYANRAKAEIYGLELAADWRPFDNLRITGSWSLLEVQEHSVGSGDPQAEQDETVSPHHRLVFRCHWDPLPELDLSGTLYWTDNLQGADIPSWLRLDLQARWRPTEDLELGLGVRNLLDDHHPEFQGTFGRVTAEVERSFYFWLDYRF